MDVKTVSSHTPQFHLLFHDKSFLYSCPDPHIYYLGPDKARAPFVVTSSENHPEWVSRAFKNRLGSGKASKHRRRRKRQQFSLLKVVLILTSLFYFLLPQSSSQDISRANILSFLFVLKNTFQLTIRFKSNDKILFSVLFSSSKKASVLCSLQTSLVLIESSRTVI